MDYDGGEIDAENDPGFVEGWHVGSDADSDDQLQINSDADSDD